MTDFSCWALYELNYCDRKGSLNSQQFFLYPFCKVTEACPGCVFCLVMVSSSK